MAGDRSLKLKAQLFCDAERAFGPGRADLLAAIAEHGSISAAGRSLGMSYRYSWLLVDSMNRCFTERLVDTSATGAALTDAGRAVLDAYRALAAELRAQAEGSAHAAALLQRLRDQPLPAKSLEP